MRYQHAKEKYQLGNGSVKCKANRTVPTDFKKE